jgi:hypothetical protein
LYGHGVLERHHRASQVNRDSDILDAHKLTTVNK